MNGDPRLTSDLRRITDYKGRQTTPLDHAIAEEFFHWKWMAFMGVPTRDAENYPAERIVRQFMSPEQLKNPKWQAYFAEHQGREASEDHSEPLSYRYCSSMGPAMVPHFSGHDGPAAAMEREIRRRELWTGYRKVLWAQITNGSEEEIDESRIADAEHADRCIAALAVIGSKYVTAAAE